MVFCARCRSPSDKLGLTLISPPSAYTKARNVLSLSDQKYSSSTTSLCPFVELQFTQANRKNGYPLDSSDHYMLWLVCLVLVWHDDLAVRNGINRHGLLGKSIEQLAPVS